MAFSAVVKCDGSPAALASFGLVRSAKLDLVVRSRIAKGEHRWDFGADNAREAEKRAGLTHLADPEAEGRTWLAWREEGSAYGADSPETRSAAPLGVTTAFYAVQPAFAGYGYDVVRIGTCDVDGRFVLDEAR